MVTYEDLAYIDEIAPEETYVCGPRATISTIYDWSQEDSSLLSLESRNWFRRTARSCKLCGKEHYFMHRKTGKKLTFHMLHICPIYKEASVSLQHNMIGWNNACQKCTNHRHTLANCPWNENKPCNVRECYKSHHTTLHQLSPGLSTPSK